MKYLAILILLSSCCALVPHSFQAETYVSTVSTSKEITCHKQTVKVEYTNSTFNLLTEADTIHIENLGFIGPNMAESYPYIVSKGNLKREPYLFGITNTETKESIVIGHQCFKLNP